MSFFKENKHANGTTSTDWGGSIAGGFGGAAGFAVIIGLIFGAIIGGGVALLWFSITGYKKFDLGKNTRIVAIILTAIYAYIVFTVFSSHRPDVMILVYANIPIAIFFVVAYIWSKRDSKYVKGTVDISNDISKSTSNSLKNNRMNRKTYSIYFISAIILQTLINMSHLRNIFIELIMLLVFITLFTYISIKRLHDIGMSGWWVLVPFIQIYLLFKKGEESENKFGSVVV